MCLCDHRYVPSVTDLLFHIVCPGKQVECEMEPEGEPLRLRCHCQERECAWVWNMGFGEIIVALLLNLGWMKHFGNDASSAVKFSYDFVHYWEWGARWPISQMTSHQLYMVKAVPECDIYPLVEPWPWSGKDGFLSACQRALSLESFSELLEKSSHRSWWHPCLAKPSHGRNVLFPSWMFTEEKDCGKAVDWYC